LIASGGHTLLCRVDEPARYEVLGQTLDDAAGEAFDKGARMLGLGYPGGPALERLAPDGDPAAFDFPTAKRVEGLDFSFAGLKTALLYKLRELGASDTGAPPPGAPTPPRADLAAAYQDAIVRSLLDRVERALDQTGLDRLALGGGVAANGPLRGRAQALAPHVHVPPIELCTDNAAMIASAARFAPALPYPDYLGLDAYATGEAAA
jgi:N6-L-threonylcarbamoyladenine synthase